MEVININGRSVACGDYEDAIDGLMREYPDEYDALHFIEMDVAECFNDVEAENKLLKSEIEETERESSGNWEHGRNCVQECKEIAEEGLKLLQSGKRLNRDKLEELFDAIIYVWNKNY